MANLRKAAQDPAAMAQAMEMFKDPNTLAEVKKLMADPNFKAQVRARMHHTPRGSYGSLWDRSSAAGDTIT